MDIARVAINNKTTTLFITLLLLLGGMYSYQKLGRLEDPEFAIKDALVITHYPGASSQEVELEVTETLETAIQELGQLDKIVSMSRPGVSTITVSIKDNYDKHSLPQVWDELRRKVSDVQSSLPPGTYPSRVMDDYGDVFGVLLSVSGKDYSYKELDDFVDFLKRELLQVKDVAKVSVWGAQSERIVVEISRARLNQLGISLNEVYGLLSQQNLVVSSGYVNVGNEYVRIQPTGNIDSIDAIRNLVVNAGGSSQLIYLKDFAEVKREYISPPQKHLRFNGEKAIALGISTASGGNVVEMGQAVKAKLHELQADIPLGIDVEDIYIQSDAVSKAINGFVVSLLQAVIIVIVVLIFFMGPLSALIIGGSLVLTVSASFIVMAYWGINLERISLGALIIALGMLVDNAIVIVEGILVRVQQGMDKYAAASQTTQATKWPLLGATVVAILAFAAIGLSNDSTGEYTRSLFQVLLISLFLSWIIAISIVPVFCTMLFKQQKDQAQSDPYQAKVFIAYKRFLAKCLEKRWWTLGGVFGLLLLSVAGFTLLEDSFFPDSTSNQFMVHYWLPEGTGIERTSQDLVQLESYVQTLEHVESVATWVGAGAPRFLLVYGPEKDYKNYGMLLITVDDYRAIDDLLAQIKQELRQGYPDANPKLEKIRLGPGGGYLIEGRFSGPSAQVLRGLSEQMKTILIEDGGFTSIRDNWAQRVKVVRPKLIEEQARRAGVTREDVANTLQSTFSGLQVGLYREKDTLIPIVSQLPDDESETVDTIDNTLVWSQSTQRAVPLRQVISKVTTGWEDPIRQRRNKQPTLIAQADPLEGNASTAFARIREKVEAIELPEGYHFEWGGEFENSSKAQQKLAANLPVTFLLMILITVVLFNAFRQPLIIWLTVPLAVIGVTWGLLFSGQSFGFMALLGFLSLSGMLIKNAIVLIDEIDVQVKDGKAVLASIEDASLSRLRPVGMAAFTTILGLVPLLKDAFFVAMAVTIMSGLAFATVLTMVVVPVFYSVFFKAQART